MPLPFLYVPQAHGRRLKKSRIATIIQDEGEMESTLQFMKRGNDISSTSDIGKQ